MSWFIVLLGVVLVTGEFHHATWTSTLLETPHRPASWRRSSSRPRWWERSAQPFLAVAAGLGLASGNVRLSVDPQSVQLVAGVLVATAWWAC